MKKDLTLIVNILKAKPIEEWISTMITLGDIYALTQEDRTRAMMLAADRSESEIDNVISEITDETEIDEMIRKASHLAATGTPEEITHNLHRLAQLTIKIREGVSYKAAFNEIYPELN